MRGDRQAPPSAADDIARARDALAAIPPDLPRAEWVRVGQAAHAAGLAFDDFDTWSAGGATYDSRAVRDVWRSFHANGGIGAGTLFFVAKTHGWHDDPAAPRPPPPTAAELARQKAEQAEAKAAKTAERQREADAAAAQAVQRLADADQADPAHPYLTRKGIAPVLNLRQEGATLLVPVTRPDGAVRGLQLITATGDKRFSRSTSFAGCLWWARPPADECAPRLIVIVEGVADALTVAAAVTDAAVACAFSAGNIPAIAAALRELFPAADIIIAADADKAGRAAADKAAAAAGAIVRLPTFADPGAQLGGKAAKDWNDLASLEGLDAVRRQLHGLPADPEATPAAEPPPDDPAAADPAAIADPAAEGPHGADTASAFSFPHVFPYGDGAFIVRDDGVFFSPPDDAKGNAQPDRWICGRLDVLAITRTADGMDWGWLVAWRDPDGAPHRLVIPAEQLAGDGAEVRRELARGGLAMASGRTARELLGAFISISPQPARAWCVSTTGWHRGVYVTPTRVYGTPSDGVDVVLQHAGAPSTAPASSGTLEDWRQHVAALAVGNSRLVFIMSAAFAGPMMGLLGVEGGGLHARGASSLGKSITQAAAASICGDPAAVVRSWRATAAGLEGIAAQHNDGTLFLDEIGEADPRQVGEVAYFLANGRGKQRSSATGAARPVTTWRLLFVSTGELSLAAHMATAGRRPAAGQELRIADIEADAGAGHGLFEHLHGHPNARALADALRDAAGRFHGTAGPAWLAWLAERRQEIADSARAALDQFVAAVLDEAGNPSAQAGRMARRFGAVAVAGEQAARAGITGWAAGEAIQAAIICFRAWIDTFGRVPAEERALLDGVREFIERHGASRFRDFTAASHVVHHLAGYYRIDDGRRIYLLHRSGLAEACHGADLRWATRVLIARGWIRPGADGRPTHHLRPEGVSDLRLYWLDPAAWADEN